LTMTVYNVEKVNTIVCFEVNVLVEMATKVISRHSKLTM
jgi:hypothetical protein